VRLPFVLDAESMEEGVRRLRGWLDKQGKN